MDTECVKIVSVTYANKAKEVLKGRGIRVRIKKSISEDDGCSYFLEIDKKHFDRAVSILRENGISFERCGNC